MAFQGAEDDGIYYQHTQNYTPNNSFQVGWQWVNHGRSVRLAIQLYEGKSMFGQFYTKNESWIGFGGYYNF